MKVQSQQLQIFVEYQKRYSIILTISILQNLTKHLGSRHYFPLFFIDDFIETQKVFGICSGSKSQYVLELSWKPPP